MAVIAITMSNTGHLLWIETYSLRTHRVIIQVKSSCKSWHRVGVCSVQIIFSVRISFSIPVIRSEALFFIEAVIADVELKVPCFD